MTEPRGPWRHLTGWPAACVVLAGMYALMITSLTDKCVTSDELVHLTGGYSYWKFNDYRINPENGMLPQRLAGLALLPGGWRLPPKDSPDWIASDEWALGRAFFYRSGNDPGAILRAGRMACGLLAVLFGAVVYGWSRQLVGRTGAMVALLCCALSPIVLANGALATSDMAAAAFFLLSLWAFWSLLQQVRPLTLTLSCLATAGLFVAKMQAGLILPVLAALVIVRVLARAPLPVTIRRTRHLAGRGPRAGVLAGVLLAHAAVAVTGVWACYGFRYEMLNARTPQEHAALVWEVVLDSPVPYSQLERMNLTGEQLAAMQRLLAPAHGQADLIHSPGQREAIVSAAYEQFRREALSPEERARLDRAAAEAAHPGVVAVFNFFREHRLLPEAYLHGHAYVLRHSRWRMAYFNGEVRDEGWRSFFPWLFLTKTPLAFFAVLGLAGVGAWRAWRGAGGGAGPITQALYTTCPLWLFGVLYWAVVIPSHINIGHRHLLPAYGPLFVLAGGAGLVLAGRAGRALGGALAVLLVLLAGEMLAVWPNYIPYFNPLVGMSNGYKHVADSSVDWGQDLPALKRFIDDRRARQPARAVYVSYFGNGDLNYYGIDALRLPCFPPEHNQQSPAPLAGLHEGTYYISASMLTGVLYRHFLGPWCPRYEREYQLGMELTRLLQRDAGGEAVVAYLEAKGVRDVAAFRERYEALRMARLCAMLRDREPSGQINHSILVYELSGDDIRQALEGPSPRQGAELAIRRP
ncbi:MAG: glycosyltransferase family 39 protein [Planctomycetota bacterium]|nr:glycosyltransferase family 39 protein [Planctomycetota bacterium]